MIEINILYHIDSGSIAGMGSLHGMLVI